MGLLENWTLTTGSLCAMNSWWGRTLKEQSYVEKWKWLKVILSFRHFVTNLAGSRFPSCYSWELPSQLMKYSLSGHEINTPVHQLGPTLMLKTRTANPDHVLEEPMQSSCLIQTREAFRMQEEKMNIYKQDHCFFEFLERSVNQINSYF